jgi:5'-deoxynucleotidase YfbR-like HD superfamily hydrolase
MTGKSNAKVPPEKLVQEILDLYSGLLVPFMKVRRDISFPTEHERQETDGEHTFTISIVAITVAERLNLELNTGLIAKYGLVHDLVEAYAGDISALAEDELYYQKHVQEKAAFQKIKRKYSKSAPWIGELIEKYEQQADEESKFVYGVDKCMGALVQLADNGKSWTDYYPEPDGRVFHKVLKRMHEKSKNSPHAFPLVVAMYAELDSRWPAWIKEKSQK